MLYIVSTPIGNIKDITLRALDVFKEVDLILAEDKRRIKKLLKEYQIPYKDLSSYNDINKNWKTKHVINLLKEGKEVAIVSDSGTPGINDPGFYLVREAISNDINVSPIPGACALISALVCSGLPTDKFGFFGFFPKKESKKRDVLGWISKMDKLTFVYYESPHRIHKTLALMNELIPDKNIVIGRELTKKFEEFIRGKVSEVYSKVGKLKGELVVLIN